MRTVRAKFYVDRIEATMSQVKGPDETWGPGEVRTVVMRPVSAGTSKENDAFWDATPAGELTLGIVNVQAVEHMAVGKEYYIDIIEAAEPEPEAAPDAD